MRSFPPCASVVPAIGNAVGFAVKVTVPTVKIDVDVGDEAGRGIVLLPTTKAATPNEMRVPEMVIAGAPGVKVEPAMMTTPGGQEVMIGGAGRGMVLVPMTMAEDPIEMGVPDTVIPEAPGVRVEPSIKTAPGTPEVMICPPAVSISGIGADDREGAS